MTRDNWFRNREWSASIEEAFFAKLGRARDKSQYLRIQASNLAEKHPHVALRLLEEYFSFGENFDHAQAYVDRASAHLALGNVEAALDAYEAALAIEERRPNLKTQAYLNLPFTIACKGITARYERALNILGENKARLIFPVDYFCWHTSYALIYLDQGRRDQARAHSACALDAAKKDHSGFRYHPTVALVGNTFDGIRQKLIQNAV